MKIEIDEEDIKQSKIYRSVLDHRRSCTKWGREFCLECFGKGLVMFSENVLNELKKKQEDVNV